VIKNGFAKGGFGTASSVNTNNDNENCEWVELQCHAECPSTFNGFLKVNKPAPTSRDQPTSLDSPGPSSMHVRGKEEEKTDETRRFPPNPLAKML
jgi:hypothetical protein